MRPRGTSIPCDMGDAFPTTPSEVSAASCQLDRHPHVGLVQCASALKDVLWVSSRPAWHRPACSSTTFQQLMLHGGWQGTLSVATMARAVQTVWQQGSIAACEGSWRPAGTSCIACLTGPLTCPVPGCCRRSAPCLLPHCRC